METKQEEDLIAEADVVTHEPEQAIAVNPKSEAHADPLNALLADPQQLAQCPIETVERLFELQRRNRADQARISFYESFNAAQLELEPVRKKGWNPSTRSAHAKAEDIEKMLQPIIYKHGFSYSTSGDDRPEATPGLIPVKLHLRHVDGHEENHTLVLPIDNVGFQGGANKTKLHGTLSSYTYAGRCLLTYVWGIQLVPDTDGTPPKSTEPIETEQLRDLESMISEIGADTMLFCKYLGVSNLKELPDARLKEAIRILEKKRVQNTKKREQVIEDFIDAAQEEANHD